MLKKMIVSFSLIIILIVVSFSSISAVHAENDIPDIIELRSTDYLIKYYPLNEQ